jgi:hypothetical protein
MHEEMKVFKLNLEDFAFSSFLPSQITLQIDLTHTHFFSHTNDVNWLIKIANLEGEN